MCGLGISGKIGWGQGWNHIAITYQGIGLRSSADLRLRGSLWVSAGYEQNYMRLIKSIAQLHDYAAWTKSCLLGLCKKYSISKKFNGELRLLVDFLSYQQRPATSPILFRVGYSLK